MKRVVASVTDTTFLKLGKMMQEKEDFAAFLERISRDQALYSTINQKIQEGTRSLQPMWMRNFGDNLPLIREGKTLRDLAEKEVVDGRAVVMGRGPSIFRENHLFALRDSGFEGAVVASDGILIDSLKAGLVPHYVLSIDGSPIVKKWFDHHLVDKYAPKIKAVMCGQVDHGVVERVIQAGFDVYWFQPAMDSVEDRRSVTRFMILMTVSKRNPDGFVALEVGGNVGACSWMFAWNVLKRKNVALLGLDYGYPEDIPLKESYYFDKTVAALGAVDAKIHYDTVFHPFFKTTSFIDPAFKSYREGFFDTLLSKPNWQRTVNCSGGGTLFHPKMECMHFADWLKEEKK